MTKLKFLPRTLEIIQNFSIINPSLLFRKGSVIRTRNSGNNLYGVARVEENFEQEFAIYDLSRFLGILSTFDEPILKFGEKNVTILEGSKKLTYTFCNVEDIVVAPDKDMTIPKPFVKVDLPKSELERVLKSQAILALPEFIISGTGGADGKIMLQTTNSEVKTTDSFSTVIGKTDQHFNVVVKAELLQKLETVDYSLEISRNNDEGIIALRGKDVDYFVAPEPNSVYP
jgi:hypothetical protein